MDTDDLTEMAYHTIRLGNDAHDVLKTEIGASASLFKSENEFLKGNLKEISEIIQDPEDYLDWWDLIDEVDIDEFKNRLYILKNHMERTLNIPIKYRGRSDLGNDSENKAVEGT